MSIKYVDEVVYEGSMRLLQERILNYSRLPLSKRPRWNLVRTDHFITVFHEFRYLMPANAGMITLVMDCLALTRRLRLMQETGHLKRLARYGNDDVEMLE